ncbi:crotonase/enoyl-CoA hydratase family protein [Ketobacter sp. MCCC 1A13808]|uniref:crotonase/enoyl-CoA hydratase family protein n=1 Tax=Ketobacter sp. MCCC 1A13808 TaxID=2602738 RepID=UPI000F0DDE03|nr:crotonase/enoyl-CoA hydratase family protein [Ketobacter sp. MCCC 1A13808]MVF12183.1 crotonase/enoyl-CoA hydratase family protein [Ketobacter sp. MCCC 1A13808]RLP53725.1 MAG: crotonase/enoyl-CoA hydratase family protein [Ketobacter sp.]
MSERVTLNVENDIAYVTLNRPEKHNGMDLEMLRAMIKAQKKARKLKGIRAVIVQGAGASFCSGLDFKSVLAKPASAFTSYMKLWSLYRNDFQTWSIGWREVGVPVIAVMHGNCFGAGLQLALGADIRISHPQAKISMMEAKWGLVPDMGGCLTMRELLPLDVAKELTMTGRILDAEQAREIGLITHLSDDPHQKALQLIDEIKTRSPDSVAAAKYLLQDAWRVLDSAALKAERIWQRRIIGRKNQRTSVKRNQEKGAAPFSERQL